MALDRVEIRCTDNEKKSWEIAASKTPFRKVGTWLKWLANAAAETPLEMKLTIAGSNPVAESPGTDKVRTPMESPPSKPRYDVQVDLDEGLPVVFLNGEDIGPPNEPTLMNLRMQGVPGSVITEIRKKLRELN